MPITKHCSTYVDTNIEDDDDDDDDDDNYNNKIITMIIRISVRVSSMLYILTLLLDT